MQRVYYGEIVEGQIKLDNENEWDELYKKYSGQSVEISVRFLGKRRNSKHRLESILEESSVGVGVPKELEHAETSWFGTPIVCRDKEQKDKLVSYFEEIKVQTRNYFAGNILLHPGYRDLDDYRKYPNSNEVLDKVFFIGASPHYNDEIFNYIEKKLRNL